MHCSPPTRNTIADTVQWFEFHNSAANLSVFVIRGTASATDVVKDFDIWNEVALPQLLASMLRECCAACRGGITAAAMPAITLTPWVPVAASLTAGLILWTSDM